jgi:hypothetical protein
MDVANQAIWYQEFKANFKKKMHGRFAPADLALFMVDEEGKRHHLRIASDVGWDVEHPGFALHHWNTWDNFIRYGRRGAPRDDALKGHPADWFEGGTLWSQYAWVIANPTPYKIKPGDYDPEKGTLKFKGNNEPINPGTRYLIEDLPQFLDQPGEYWYDAERGRIYLRPLGDGDPNDTRIEYGTATHSILIENKSHIDIAGLTFCFNGRDERPRWIKDGAATVRINGECDDITVRNCRFEHMGNDAIFMRIQPGQQADRLVFRDNDFHWINGGTAIHVQGDSGTSDAHAQGTKLGHIHQVWVLRNRARNIGLYRHNDNKWRNVPTIAVGRVRLAEVAGNIIDSTWGSGIVVSSGTGGKNNIGHDIPLNRNLVYQNKSAYNAMGVNDYGGFSLWQHGPILNFNNVAGVSLGHWPGGFFNNGTTNLSYPIYLDGAFKVFNFNNIVWAKPFDPEDPYSSSSPGFFNVFGFLNPFSNNTVYGTGSGIGGTSGNRNDIVGNLFADVHKSFIHANHGGNPSLIGGDDTGQSGIDGASTLALAHNVWAGKAHGGVIASKKRGARKDLQADDMATLFEQMRNYPLRMAEPGQITGDRDIIRSGYPEGKGKPETGDFDFRPAKGSAAIDAGATYFVPWGLSSMVGEWHFNENRADPTTVLDYHLHASPALYNRGMYHKVPTYELTVNQADLDAFTPGVMEDWCRGAMVFDGRRSARITHQEMARDIVFNIKELQGETNKVPAPVGRVWEVPKPVRKGRGRRPDIYGPDATMRYPGEKRKNPDIPDTSMMAEVVLRIDAGHTGGGILSKFDGETGYRLFVNDDGGVSFAIAGGQASAIVASPDALNDGEWFHIVGELDRAADALILYVNGKEVGRSDLHIGKDSLSNPADFLVGLSHDERTHLEGAIDYMRITRSSLAESRTSIGELYAWQFDGPFRYDFTGRPPSGKRRDAGAIEFME